MRIHTKQTAKPLIPKSTFEPTHNERLLIQHKEQGYAPQSGAITGILKQMGDTMAAALKDAAGSNNSTIASCGYTMKICLDYHVVV